jgi:hypothetical protein
MQTPDRTLVELDSDRNNADSEMENVEKCCVGERSALVLY